MLGTTLGPYRFDAELGSGGMGTVYRATGAAGEVVAIKVVHPHLLAVQGFRERFDREARLGLAIRHRNVVATLACLEADVGGRSVPALVLEHVEGRSLTELLAEQRRVPEDLCRHLAREIARGLEAIHATGIVHRDLKPGNVLITPRHEVKVMDLGLARAVSGDDRLSATGVFVGTAAYAPPEQFRGKARLDPRSDLYSLGVMLYELATGEPPFRGRNMADLVRQVLHERPRRPTALAPQITAFFEEMLLRLIAKSPAGRIRSAQELGEILDEGERSAWWKEAVSQATRVVGEPLQRARAARETDLWGREKELAVLAAAWDSAQSGEGRVVLVEGETGIGKSRLVDEFLAGLAEDDVSVLYGGYPPGGDAAAAGAFATAYRAHFGAERLEDTIRPHLAETPLLVPAFVALLRGDAPPVGAVPLTRDSLQTVFVHATRSLARERPVVVVIDDLHFASQEGRGVFAALALALPGHRVLLVGTTRPGLPAPWVAELERCSHVARLAVERLDDGTVRARVAAMLGTSLAAEDLARRIATKADGNPYFVLEILRGLRESGHLTQADDGTWRAPDVARDVDIPSSVRDLVAARLSALAEEDREVLEAAACAGHEFDGRLVAEALARPRLDVLRRLGRLERETSLVRAVGVRFAFDHHVAHEALYAATPQALREELHAAIGEALERSCGAAPDGALRAEIADHLLRGARGAQALRWLDPALTHLEKTYRNEAAIALAGRALAVPGLLAGAQRGEVLLRVAGRLDLLGRREAERAALDEAVALADSAGDESLRARARRALGWHLATLSRHEEAEPVLRAAADIARAAGDAKTEAAATGNLGNLAFLTARYREAQSRFESAGDIARACGDRQGEAGSLGNVGAVHWTLGNHAEARDHFERGLAIARELGDRGGEVTGLINLGNVEWALGRYVEALAVYEKSLAVAREVGNRRSEAAAMGNVGLALRCLGRNDEARTLVVRYRALAREVGDRRGEVTATGNLGELEHTAGRTAEALELFERRLLLAREIGERWEETVALQQIGVMLGELGQPAGAREALESSLALCGSLGFKQLSGVALLGLAEVAERVGDAGEALRRAEESLALRREIGDRSGIAATLVVLGRLCAAKGDVEGARAAFGESVAISTESGLHDSLVLASAYSAALPGGDADAARAALAEHRGRLGPREQMEARFVLGRATNDPALLSEARRLLDTLVAGATPDGRASMVTNVPLNRDIAEATGKDASCPPQGPRPAA